MLPSIRFCPQVLRSIRTVSASSRPHAPLISAPSFLRGASRTGAHRYSRFSAPRAAALPSSLRTRSLCACTDVTLRTHAPALHLAGSTASDRSFASSSSATTLSRSSLPTVRAATSSCLVSAPISILRSSAAALPEAGRSASRRYSSSNTGENAAFENFWNEVVNVAQSEGADVAFAKISSELARNTGNLQFIERAAKTYLILGETEKALECTNDLLFKLEMIEKEAVLDTSSSTNKVRHLRAHINMERNQLNDAMVDLQHVLKHIKDDHENADMMLHGTHSLLGKLYTDMSSVEEDLSKFKSLSEKAYEHLRNAVQLKEEDIESLYGCGLVQMSLRDWLLAVEHFTAVLDLDQEYAPAHHQRGIALMMLGRLEEAAHSLDRYLDVQEDFFKRHLPDFADIQRNFVSGDVFLRLCACHFELGDLELAELYGDSAIACNDGPHKPLAQHLLAKVELQKPAEQMDLQKVVELNSAALDVNGTLLNAYRDRAIALQRLGRNDEANADMQVYERLASLTPAQLEAEIQRQTEQKTAEFQSQIKDKFL